MVTLHLIQDCVCQSGLVIFYSLGLYNSLDEPLPGPLARWSMFDEVLGAEIC